ncbi:hypothetical protein L1049_011508 [Liquidambar formosana]|uniref:Pentatricopeptide repeat-containing protein n=1 Tax=Liquidambar formosana TaxID=63359 RepID=A0AAP0RRE8_LIQFO
MKPREISIGWDDFLIHAQLLFLASSWSFMKASFSIINVCSAGLKLMFGRNKAYKFFSAGNIALSSSSFSEDEEYILENSSSTDNDLLPSVKCISDEFGESNEPLFSGNDNCEFVDEDSSIPKNQKLEDDEMKTIKLILAKRRWNLDSQNWYRIDLNQFNIMKILNDLFEESLDAALALYFFRWSESCTRSKHSIRLVCSMIHILVSGNMNYRAMDLILHLVRNNVKEQEGHILLLKVLHETHTERRVLQTVCSMLVDCYVKENMMGIALKSTCQMKHLNIFPSIGVCNSLLRALLRSEQLELAWDLLEEMQSQGMGFNASIISLFIYNYCTKGDLKNGWKLLMEMKNHGIKPDVVVYTIVIDSLCKMSRLKDATSILFKMTQMGISLDSVSISSIIDGYCKEGKSEEAIEILNIFNCPPNVFVVQ